ncbi:uncharacterized protein LOC122881437 [Siniperca chuatsi]|uniref:uncharacterized protein LOC122881437 n=1 Tax=Siniperca chuatsi TaxID=119488 RepID=UPI001CE18A61|nr:uncharacterized protein LOC122881437 [Siniperca chuatsi]XP_044063613.1 uncharacterized protein LOC122881437 [Siniperca chuatsi]
MNTSMSSLIMERGRQKLQNILEDGLGRDLMNAGRFCFSCEQIFANRKCLEEHMCSAASYICSCGTEFTEYKDMLEHSTTHEPGHQVLDHETIRKRRIEKRIEEEEQLKRLQTGEVVWKTPKLDNVPSISLPVNPMQSAQISQVPELYPSVSQASLLPNAISSTTDMKNIFAGVGAPTVDLWTLYQPVVLLQTVRTFNKKKPYTCGKCGQCFLTRTSLISHHSSHVTDKVSGCIGCGLLLSSKKVVPRFHVCNSPNTATKFRLITARPLGNNRLNEAGTVRSQNLSAWGPQATSSLQLKSQNTSAASKGGQAPHITSTLQLKNENMKTYNKSNRGLHVTPSLQLKSLNLSASKPYVTVALPSKSQSPNPSASDKSSQGLPVTPSRQMKMPANSASGVPSKPTQTSSVPNGFTCRVCHIPFETAQLLQRHKCVKAQEFMAQHVRGGKRHYKLKRVTPVANPSPAQMNGERKLVVPASGNIKKNQVMPVGLDKGQGAAPVNGKTGVDMDEDCYIVERGQDKPAEMIYQVTSSVPIKT